jgi:hypothetical protein
VVAVKTSVEHSAAEHTPGEHPAAGGGAYNNQVVALAQRVHLMQLLTERIQEEVVVRHDEALALQADFLQVGVVTYSELTRALV